MKESWQVVLGGEGGQGLVVSGVVLGEAGVVDGKNVSQTAVYGIASRGGFAKSEVVISSEEIEFPGVEDPDAVLALSQGALEKYYGKVPEDCYIIYDNSTIDGDFPGERVIGMPLSDQVRELNQEKGIKAHLNILSLGALIGVTNLVKTESMEKALTDRFGAKAAPNIEAFKAGLELAK